MSETVSSRYWTTATIRYQVALDLRDVRDIYGFKPVVKASQRCAWDAKQHAGCIPVRVHSMTTGDINVLEVIAKRLQRIEGCTDLEIIRGDAKLRPQVRAWF